MIKYVILENASTSLTWIKSGFLLPEVSLIQRSFPKVRVQAITQDHPQAESHSSLHSTLDSEDQTARFGLSSCNGPSSSVLVEIDPEPRRSWEATYEIASDILSPTMTVSSVKTDEDEGEHDIDIFPSRSLEPVRVTT